MKPASFKLFVVFGGIDDLELADELAKYNQVINLAGKLTPRQTCYALTKALITISLDSFVKHAAAVARKPVIEISPLAKNGNMDSEFGNKRFVPFGVPFTTIRPDIQLAPCGSDGCYMSSNHCILTISTPEIAEALFKMLQRISLDIDGRNFPTVML